MSITTHLEALLPSWLPEQRWFAGKDTPITAVAIDSAHCWSREHQLWHLIVAVEQQTPESGRTRELYQVPVTLHREPQAKLEHVLLGELPDGRLAYDALHDRDAMAAVLALFGAPDGPEDDTGDFRFITEPGVTLPTAGYSLVLTAEQSNTSLVYDGQALLKVFRRLQPGRNPDIEVHDALTRAGCEDIAPLLGWIEGPVAGGTGSLAMLQEFLPTATDGWALATASVRDLYAEADLHAEEVGGDFASEAARLGAATAGVHAVMASALPTRTLSSAEVAELAERLTARVRAGIEAVPQLAPHTSPLLAAMQEIQTAQVRVQRVHGDLHLGQALRTVTGWKLVDFEGEPAAPLAERVALDAVERDVAGMLRSFDYAAAHLYLVDHEGNEQIAYRAQEWAQRNSDAFCRGYATVSGSDPREASALLRAYELDKAVYEAVYESRNRPAWLTIPLSAIERLVS